MSVGSYVTHERAHLGQPRAAKPRALAFLLERGRRENRKRPVSVVPVAPEPQNSDIDEISLRPRSVGFLLARGMVVERG